MLIIDIWNRDHTDECSAASVHRFLQEIVPCAEHVAYGVLPVLSMQTIHGPSVSRVARARKRHECFRLIANHPSLISLCSVVLL